MPLTRDQLNQTYKCRAPRLQETVHNAQTDLLMASLVTRITMKVTQGQLNIGEAWFILNIMHNVQLAN